MRRSGTCTARRTAAAASRLRTHPNKDVAARAVAMLDELNPMAKMRKEMIAKIAPIVEQKGDPVAGKALFTTCQLSSDISICTRT